MPTYPEFFLMVGGGSLDQVAWVLATQRQEKLSINNQRLFIET